jgi:hypothetical protein
VEGNGRSNLAERIFSGFTISPVFRANSSRPFNLLVGADINSDRHPTTDRPPGAGRNTGIGPSFWTFDLRLTRQFGLGGRAQSEVHIRSIRSVKSDKFLKRQQYGRCDCSAF